MNKTQHLREVLEAGGDLDSLLASWAPDVRAIAQAAARRVGVHRAHERDEIEALAWTEVARMIDDERTGAARSVYEFDAHLVMRLRNAVRLWLDSEVGHAPASGMATVLRRRRAILGLVNDGMTPHEAVELLSGCRHKDGSYKVADLEVQPVTQDIDGELHQVRARLDPGEMAELMMGPSAGYVIAPFEGRAFVESVVADVEDLDDRAARVVRAWLETVWAEDEKATGAALSRRLGLPYACVKEAVALGRRVAAARLARMGVHITDEPQEKRP